MNNTKPKHPGKFIQEYFSDITVANLAKQLNISRQQMHRIIAGNSGISADVALRLSNISDTRPEFMPEYWLGLQNEYDLWHARQKLMEREND